MKEQQHNIHDTTIWVEDTISIHDDTRGRLGGSGTMAPPTMRPTTSMDPRRILSSPVINNDASSEVDDSLWTTPSKEESSSSSPGTDSKNYHPRGGVLLPETTAATKKLTSNHLPNETTPHPHAHGSCSDGSNGRMRIIIATGSMDVPRTPPDMAYATRPLHTTATTTTGVMWVPLGVPTAQSFLQANMGAALDLLAEDPKKEDDAEEEENQCEAEDRDYGIIDDDRYIHNDTRSISTAATAKQEGQPA